MKLTERDPHDDRCSACREPYTVAYDRGASVLNPKKRVQLCDRHLSEFCAELDAWELERGLRLPEAPRKRNLRELVRQAASGRGARGLR